MTPKDYLEKYCRVNHRRNVLYKRAFDKYRDTEGELTIEVSRIIDDLIKFLVSLWCSIGYLYGYDG